MINTEIVKRKIELLPDHPGCYLMKNKDGTIIYVGKAKSLVKRVDLKNVKSLEWS